MSGEAIPGGSMARELAYTARNFDGAEAKAIGLVNRCYATPEELHAGVGELARCIAESISRWYV